MSFPPYPEYKDSGVEWLGEVPRHWAVTRMRFVARVQTGVAKGKDNAGKATLQVPYLRVANVQDGYLDLDNVATIEIPADDMPRYQLQVGDVLMNEGGDFDKLGRGHIWDGSISPCIHQNHVFAVRPVAVSPQWLNLVTSSAYAQFYFMSRSKQSTNLASISSTNIMELPVVLPTEDEQKSITTFLDRETANIDALVAEQEKLIELLQEKRQAVISQAVTKGLDPNVPMKNSGVEWLGEVPVHWEVKPLRYCVDFQEGPGILADDFRDDGVPLIRVAGVQSRSATLEGCNYLDSEKVARRWQHFRVSSGDLLVSASASMGTISEVGPEVEGAIPYTGIIRMRGRDGEMIKDFLRHVFVSCLFLTQIDLLKAGATIQHYGPTHLSQMFVVRPPISEQVVIAEFIDQELTRFDELSSEAERIVNLLQERRTALIYAAVTGQIDVRSIASQEIA